MRTRIRPMERHLCTKGTKGTKGGAHVTSRLRAHSLLDLVSWTWSPGLGEGGLPKSDAEVFFGLSTRRQCKKAATVAARSVASLLGFLVVDLSQRVAELEAAADCQKRRHQVTIG